MGCCGPACDTITSSCTSALVLLEETRTAAADTTRCVFPTHATGPPATSDHRQRAVSGTSATGPHGSILISTANLVRDEECCWGPFGDHTPCTRADDPHVDWSCTRR